MLLSHAACWSWGKGEAELFMAQRRAGGGFPCAECHSPVSALLPGCRALGWPGLLPAMPAMPDSGA